MADEKVSKEYKKAYKKAYNQADMICNYMPHLLKGMTTPENEPSVYTKGFQDRVRQYEIEQDAIKNFSYDQLKEKYGKDVDGQNKDKSKGIDKD